jgi:F-type H+-transporting ATPase subunit f
MQKVVSFYEKLPRGPAPEPEGKGLLGRYQKKYMGKNASARRTYISKEFQIASLGTE